MSTHPVLIALILTIGAASVWGSEKEDRLVGKILALHPASNIRPVKNSSEAITVKFGISLQNINQLDEENDKLHTHIWFNYEWQDDFMTWNKTEYDGIHSVRVKLDKVWKPDIEVYNMRGEGSIVDTHAVVYSDGSVNYVPPAWLTTSCSVDLSFFPFDTQTCLMKFGSWTYDGSKVNLTLRNTDIDMSNYQPNKKWQLVATSGERNVKKYECCPEPYIDVTFRMTLKRNPTYFTFIYLGPVVMLSLLAPFIFLLPPADPQKLTLGSGLLICLSLFFVSLGNVLPGMHAHTPLIDKYYMAMYVLLCVALSLSTLVTNIARRTFVMKHPPDFIKQIIVSCLGRCMCVSVDMYVEVPSGEDLSGEMRLVDRQESRASSSSSIKEWLLIATVLDRLFFIIFLILTIILTVTMLNAYPRE